MAHQFFLKQIVVFNSLFFFFICRLQIGWGPSILGGGPPSELHIYLDPKGLLAAVCSSQQTYVAGHYTQTQEDKMLDTPSIQFTTNRAHTIQDKNNST